MEREDAIPEVEAIREDFPDGVDGRGPNVRFSGAEAGSSCESCVSRCVAARALGDDGRRFEIYF